MKWEVVKRMYVTDTVKRKHSISDTGELTIFPLDSDLHKDPMAVRE